MVEVRSESASVRQRRGRGWDAELVPGNPRTLAPEEEEEEEEEDEEEEEMEETLET